MTSDTKDFLAALIAPLITDMANVKSDIAEIKDDVKATNLTIHGNGSPGLKGDVIRLKTIVALVAGIAIVGTGMASCAITGKVIRVPQVAEGK